MAANNSKLVVVKGTSATGKGTRVVQLLKFLQSKHKSKNAQWDHKGRKRQLGVEFPELKIIFIGMMTVSNKSGLTSWTSMDYIHSTLMKVNLVPDVLRPWFDAGYTIICEGEPMMQSNRWRPEFLSNEFGCEDFFFQYYYYNGDRKPYDARIVGRSGEVAGEAGWLRERTYKQEYDKIRIEMETNGHGLASNSSDKKGNFAEFYTNKSMAHINLFDEPLREFGIKVLLWLGMSSMEGDFLQFVDKKPMLRDINGNDPLATVRKLW